ncbi:translation factor [Jaminaea rosea]|uniref:Threonylcarbamoyl-AMP synthase n=1 Tax=Jaminaea rosea TaxID=1569628 RepID=A0A316UWZ0_9BASI|nr:translation factor [Jaminaea rosea]PWN29827.1 translation factor [Jaminaea rosea]
MATKAREGEASSSSSSSSAPAYPDRTFDTIVLPTDSDLVTFSDPSSSNEPLRRARLAAAGPTTTSSLREASSALRQDLPVAFPTETVYGLSANALSSSACKAIFAAKGRPQDNPLIVHVCDLEMAEEIVAEGWVPPPCYEELMRRFWPGGITFLMPAARPGVTYSDQSSSSSWFQGKGTSPLPLLVTSNHPLVGIRMPSHPLARALIAHSRLPLAAPSANASGRPSPTTAQHVLHDLKGRIPYVLGGGASSQGVESTVVDGVTEPGELRVLRPGAVSPEEIEECLSGLSGEGAVRLRVYGRDMVRQEAFEAAPTTPGMKYRHYSPTAPVVVFVPSKEARYAKAAANGGSSSIAGWSQALSKEVQALVAAKPDLLDGKASVHVGLMLLTDSALAQAMFAPEEAEMAAATGPAFPLSLDDGSQAHILIQPFSLGRLSQPHLPARRLFSGLRSLDEGGVNLIVVEAVEEKGIGLAVMNRVGKAAGGTVAVSV